jgi:hypothetical protein
MNRLTAQGRGLLLGGTAAVVAGLAVVAGVMSPAHAEVDPKDKDARFISLYDKGCTVVHYRAEGHMIGASNSTWKVWEGGLNCGKTVFAWKPANNQAQIDVVITSQVDGTHIRTFEVDGDKNFCVVSDKDGNWHETGSSNGSGGSGDCTAD